jgi:hypothetical protein
MSRNLSVRSTRARPADPELSKAKLEEDIKPKSSKNKNDDGE